MQTSNPWSYPTTHKSMLHISPNPHDKYIKILPPIRTNPSCYINVIYIMYIYANVICMCIHIYIYIDQSQEYSRITSISYINPYQSIQDLPRNASNMRCLGSFFDSLGHLSWSCQPPACQFCWTASRITSRSAMSSGLRKHPTSKFGGEKNANLPHP